MYNAAPACRSISLHLRSWGTVQDQRMLLDGHCSMQLMYKHYFSKRQCNLLCLLASNTWYNIPQSLVHISTEISLEANRGSELIGNPKSKMLASQADPRH